MKDGYSIFIKDLESLGHCRRQGQLDRFDGLELRRPYGILHNARSGREVQSRAIEPLPGGD